MESLRYSAVYWKTLDGLQLLGSLVLDSITCPYIETVGEEGRRARRRRGSPANLISEITNLAVLDH